MLRVGLSRCGRIRYVHAQPMAAYDDSQSGCAYDTPTLQNAVPPDLYGEQVRIPRRHTGLVDSRYGFASCRARRAPSRDCGSSTAATTKRRGLPTSRGLEASPRYDASRLRVAEYPFGHVVNSCALMRDGTPDVTGDDNVPIWPSCAAQSRRDLGYDSPRRARLRAGRHSNLPVAGRRGLVERP